MQTNKQKPYKPTNIEKEKKHKTPQRLAIHVQTKKCLTFILINKNAKIKTFTL